MAAAYTTDLATITAADATTAETGALGAVTWSEPTGSTAGGTPTQETDYFIHGTAIIAKSYNATGIGGLGAATASAAIVPSDGAVFVWTYFAAPNALATKANGGMQILVGNTAANYKRYYVAGSDTYTYGGFVCYPINPLVTASATNGTPTAVNQFFGMAANVVNAVARGNPFGIDAIRYGRGMLQCVGGDVTNGYASFSGAAAVNDTNTVGAYNRWGILSYSGGTYKLQGLLALGSVDTPVDFRDSNVTIAIQNTEFVSSGFNAIEIRNAASRVDLTGISISALGTVSKGNFSLLAAATVNLTSCTFSDMDTFDIRQSTANINSCIFRRSGTLYVSSAYVDNCTIEFPTAPVQIDAVYIDRLTNTTFIGTGGVAILTVFLPEFLEVRDPSLTLNGLIFQNCSINIVIHINNIIDSITVYITGGGNTPTVTSSDPGVPITVVNSKTFTVTNIISGSEVRIFRQSDLVELAGAEVVGSSPSGQTGGAVISADPDNPGRYRLAYSYGYSTDTPIFVVTMHLNYQAVRSSAALKSTDGSLQIAQITDRQYSNL